MSAAAISSPARDSSRRNGLLHSLNSLSASDAVRERLLKATVAHAIAKSPYYAERLRGIDPEDVSLANIHELPLLTKSDLTNHIDRLLTEPRYPDHLMYTSGTTGRPLEVPVYQEEIDANEQILLSAWQRNIDEEPPLVLTIIRIGHGTHIFSGRIPSLPCHIQFGLGQFIEMLSSEHRVNGRRLRPTVIDLNVLCLRQITSELLSSGRDPRSFGIELLIVAGWYMPDWERAFFERAWGAEILERYGVTEVHGDAKRGPGKRDYIFDFAVIPEVIDPVTSKPIDEGVGLMVLTGLYPFNQAVPKLRYVIGDLVEVRRTDEFGGELGVRFLARSRDAISAPPGAGVPYRFFSSDVADALAPIPDVARKTNTGFLKFVLKELSGHGAAIDIELTYHPALFPDRVESLRAQILDHLALRSRFRGNADVTVEFVGPGAIESITKL